MKTFRFFGMVVVAILLSLNFIACSDDDDNDYSKGSSLAGTTWKIVSVAAQNEEWRIDFEGYSVTFKSDGSVVFSPDVDWSYAKWSLNEDVLKFTLGEGFPDENVVGKIIFDGNTATWHCYWEDVNGRYSYKDKPEYHAILTLRKQ